MKYTTFEIACEYKDGLKIIEVVACDLESAKAHCADAGYVVVSARIVK